MLTEDIIVQLQSYSGDEDAALWSQGDVLRDNEITKDEIKRLAVILQQSPAKLLNRKFVAGETPVERRRDNYSWMIYSIFTKIVNREQRFQLLFSRPDWSVAEARGIVRAFTPAPSAEQNKLTHVERAVLKVGNVTVKAKLNPKGELTLLVNLGANRECEVTPQSANTKIVFPA